MALLEVDDVSVRFGGQMALESVSLAVDEGCVTGLIGPNGAGKTTLFNVVTGLIRPERGRVLLDGVDVTDAQTHVRARRGMSRTFQRLELFGSLTGRENLQMAAEIGARRRGRAQSAQARVSECIEMVAMQEFADVRSDCLTTGQARLVELGRALVTRPKVLLLDEPASGLDADETDGFAELLGRLAGEGMGLLLVEHDMRLVMRTCTRLFVLDYGRVLADGSPAEVQRDPAVADAYLGPMPQAAT